MRTRTGLVAAAIVLLGTPGRVDAQSICRMRTGTYVETQDWTTFRCRGPAVACESAEQAAREALRATTRAGDSSTNEYNLSGKWETRGSKLLRVLTDEWCTVLMTVDLDDGSSLGSRLEFDEPGTGAKGYMFFKSERVTWTVSISTRQVGKRTP
jgi:hypothetical protein